MINDHQNMHNNATNTHLHLINRPSLRIPITMNNNSIVALINEVCTSTYIIEIRRTPNPIMKLSDEKKEHQENKIAIDETILQP